MANDQGRERPDEIPEDGPLQREDGLEPRKPVVDPDDPDDDNESDEDEDVEIPDRPLDPSEEDPDDLPPRE